MGHFVSTVGRNEKVIRVYIQNQEAEDKRIDQMKLFNPYGGSPNRFKRPTTIPPALPVVCELNLNGTQFYV